MNQARYLTQRSFKKVAAQGEKMGFNRQIAPWVLDRLVSGKCAVTKLMSHSYIGGRPAEPYVRALVQFRLTDGENGSVIIDIKAATFESLPTQTLPPLRGRKKYRLAQPQAKFSLMA